MWNLEKRYCCYLVAKSCPTLCNIMDCSLLGSFVHEISQARILEYVAISFSMESFWPQDWTWVSSLAGGILLLLFFTSELPEKNGTKEPFGKAEIETQMLRTHVNTKEGKGGGRMDWEIGTDMCPLLCWASQVAQWYKGMIPGWRRSSGEGNGKPFQCSCPENTTDRGAWHGTVHGAAESQMWLSERAYSHMSIKQITAENPLWAQGAPLSALCWPEWAGSPKQRGYVYTCSWYTLLYSRNQHNIVKQLYSNKS